MSRSEPEPSDAVDLDERLVAYLDRELPDSECEEIERRLAEDADLRDRVSGLDRVWNVLDEAPRTTTDRGFANTTVAVVVGEAEKLRMRRARPWLWKRLLVGLVGMAVGFVLVRGVSSRDDRRLINDLPAIRYASVLGQADDGDYLRRIMEEAPSVIASVNALGLRSEAETWGAIAAATPPERAQWLAERTEAEQAELIDQAIAFRAQSPTRARRLIEFERSLHSDEQADQLRLAALSHHAMLSVLPAGDRATYLSLPADERIKQLKQKTRRWSQPALMRLNDDEQSAFRDGVLKLAESGSVSVVIDRLEKGAERLRKRGDDPPGRGAGFFREQRGRYASRLAALAAQFREHPEHLVLMVTRLQANKGRSPWQEVFPNAQKPEALWDEWESSLLESLPARARQTVEAGRSASDRARLLLDPLERVVSPARRHEVSRYFAEELSNREMQDYLAMPVTEMQDELRERMGEESFGGPPMGGRGGPRGRPRGEPPGFRPGNDPRGGLSPKFPPPARRPPPREL